MSVKLNHRVGEDLTLRDALRRCAAVLKPSKSLETVSLLYSPERCRFAVLAVEGAANETAVQLLDEQGNEIAASFLDRVFEARVFNPRAELRWLHKSAGKGAAALLSEQDISGCLSEPPHAGFQYEQLDQLEPLETRYLLWGESAGVAGEANWQHLTAARIGYLNVPLTGVKLNDGDRVQLVAREYLSEVDKHGNVAVVEERLLKLEVA